MTEPDRQHIAERSRLLTLVFTDLVDSVGLKSRLGDTEAGRLIDAHHRVVKTLVDETGGRKVFVAGDGCFVTFETPSAAVEFALLLQDHHRKKTSLPNVRIGIHMGEVTERLYPADALRQVDVEGLAVDIASRFQTLALPGQILLSYPVFDNARQRLDSTRWTLPVEWRAHGRYIFQGSDMALDIYEVGLKGASPFMPPSGGSKAQRDVQDEEESTLGWRPAQGLPLPGRPHWVLVEKLGEGGFGDVWLVEHEKTRERHVVKFCYSADRLKALKREVTLFRLLKETLGARNDIARVLDFQFDVTPYYLEIEFAGSNTLSNWLNEHGGPHTIALELRLELVAQVADAIAAAHSVGVLHKDIKPSNIMVTQRDDGSPQIKMIDFGIGSVEDRKLLDNRGITMTGLTEVESSSDKGSTLTGTRLYMAPELIEGKNATTKSDIYSLGVLLYQMISGKLGQALAPGWERDIPDPLLREDIAACVDGEPEKRLKAAEELSWRLRHMSDRRAKILHEQEKVQQEILRRQRSQRRRIIALIASGCMLMLLALCGVYALVQAQKASTEAILRQKAEVVREQALDEEKKTHVALQKVQQARYFSSIALAEARLHESRYEKAQEVLLEDPPANFLGREWGWLLAQTAPENFALKNRNFFDAAFTPDGKQVVIGSRDVKGLGYIAFYDASTAERTTKVTTNKRLVWNLAISPDGRYAATASSDTDIAVVDLSTNKKIARLTGHTEIVRDVAFSPNNQLLASCGRDRTVRLWTTRNMRPFRALSVGDDSPTEISFSPDSKFIACGSLEGNTRIFDTESGKEVCQLGGHTERVLSVAFLANGKGIATASTNSRTYFYHWPPEPGQTMYEPYLTVESEDTYPSQVLSSHDGESLIIGNDNGRVVMVNAQTGDEKLSFTVDQPLWKIALAKDGQRLLTTTRWSVRLIELERILEESTATALAPGTPIPESAVPIRAAAVFSPRDQTWRHDKPWRTPSGLSLVKTSLGKEFLVQNDFTVYSPDGSSYIKINPKSLRWRAKSTTSGQVLYNMKRHLCVGATFSPDSEKAVILYGGEKATVYRTGDWHALYNIPKDDSPVAALFTPDSSRLILADVSGRVNEYDANTSQLLRQLRPRGGGSPLDINLSPDGKLLALGLDQDHAVVIDMESGDQVSTMSGHVRYVHAVQFTPDSKRLVTLSRDGTAKMWDVDSGRELVTLFRFSNGVIPLGIKFGRKGRLVSVVTSDHRILNADVFPWNLKTYSGTTGSLEMRIEMWKRRQRLKPNATTADASKTAEKPAETTRAPRAE